MTEPQISWEQRLDLVAIELAEIGKIIDELGESLTAAAKALGIEEKS